MKYISNKKKYLTRQFIEQLGYTPNFDNPKTFSEKLNWLKLYYRNPLQTICANKVAARNYISHKVGSKYLIPLIGVYDNVDQIDFGALPNKIIIKSNNSSGKNIAVNSTKELDVKQTKIQLKKWLEPSSNLYYFSYEWPYKNIKSQIIIEKLLETKGDLIDFQLYCFNGEPRFVLTGSEKKSVAKVDFYSLDWKLLPISKKSPHNPNGVARPNNLGEMIKIARTLSQGFPFIRVDLYEVDDKIYTGELTFFPNAGMGVLKPIIWDTKFGEMLKLPQSPNFITKLIRSFT